MGMNPETNRLEMLEQGPLGQLLRHDGSEVPKHWATFKVGEKVVVKDYTFKVAYIGEMTILLEPVAPVLVALDQLKALVEEKSAAELKAKLESLQARGRE